METSFNLTPPQHVLDNASHIFLVSSVPKCGNFYSYKDNGGVYIVGIADKDFDGTTDAIVVEYKPSGREYSQRQTRLIFV